MLSNLMMVPHSVSSDSARVSGRWANRPPAAHTGWTSVKSQLDPSECPPNIQPETNFTWFNESPAAAFEKDDEDFITQLKRWLVEMIQIAAMTIMIDFKIT